MKVLTLTQPWAQLVAIGAKRIETRSWSTRYRGPLAIHAAKGLGPLGGDGPSRLAHLCFVEPFKSALIQAYGEQASAEKLRDMLPRGAIIAVCELIAIYRITDQGVEGFRPQPPPNEIAFGNYSPGRYAWLLANVRALPEPVPATGQQGLWTYEGEL